MRAHKIIIVGAGPGGSACALALARSTNSEIVLLDKSQYPRRKVCGSGLSPVGLGVLDDFGLIEELTPHHVHLRNLQAIGPDGGSVVLKGSKGAWVVPRVVLDHTIVRAAVRQGAVLHEDTKVTDVVREALAEAADRPPFRIASDATLLELARALPADRAALSKTLDKARGIHPAVRREHSGALLRAVVRGSEAGAPPAPIRAPTLPRAVVSRFDALRAWRKAVAQARGVEPDIVLDKGTLMDIAVAAPRDLQALADSGALDAWEHERYGADIVAWLDKRTTG